MASLTLEKGDLIIRTPYDPNLVADLKATIPAASRTWDPDRKVWIITYMYGQDMADMINQHLGVELAVPVQHTQASLETRLLKVEYIGAAKERDDGSLSATGWHNNGWNVILPLAVLRKWFEHDDGEEKKSNEKPSFYVVLGVLEEATSREIKAAYRVAARTWHPDVNNDSDATQQFQAINRAYEVLGDSGQRQKYDAGLYLQQQVDRPEQQPGYDFLADIWRPPKRCGYLKVECKMTVGRFLVERILVWQDILNRSGHTMVSYWPKNSNFFETEWV